MSDHELPFLRMERLSNGKNLLFAGDRPVGYIDDESLIAHYLEEGLLFEGKRILRSAEAPTSSDAEDLSALDQEVVRRTREVMRTSRLSPSKALGKVLASDRNLFIRYQAAHRGKK